MARKAVSAREYQDDAMSPAMLARRVGWIALGATWLFLVVALISFDSADWPSHTVASHNEPTRNLCGPVGAMIAYWCYHVIGIGSWILLAGVAGYLGVIVTGRSVTHPVVRAFGLVFMAVTVSSFHGLLAPQVGTLAGSKAGLLAGILVGEFDQRFSSVGTFLILLAGFSVGAIVAVDQLVLALPPLLGAGAKATHRAGAAPVRLLRALRTRPEAALATVGGPTTKSDRIRPIIDEPDLPDEPGPKRSRLSAEELRRKIAKLPVRMGGSLTADAKDEDIPRQESFEGYQFPTLELLQDPESNYSAKMEAFVRKQAEQLENALQTYHIDGEVVGIESGPAVTLYSVQLVPGTKVAKIQAVASDLARSLRAHNIRLVPNMAGKTTVGIEIPNLYKERVRLKELMSGGHAEGMVLPMFLGKDASGEPLVADLTRMPHMLIAGTTGSGKSVCMNSIIMSWLYTKRPDELKLILVDPKMVELSRFAQIPHLMCPVVTEMSKATAILEWAIDKMEERYELLLEAQVRDVAGYNQLTEEELYEAFKPANEAEKAKIPKRLAYIVFVIDELADLILTHKDVEHHVVRIAQKARAVGIHLIVATQRPQANVVTGLIKSNMPCRVSFKVASGMDSRIVMDQKGAELLLGQGDMLFLSPHTTEVRRAQGTLVTDGEIRRVVKFLCGVAAPQFERSLVAIRSRTTELDEEAESGERDPLFEEAVEIMIESGRGSVSLLQRRLAIGYSRSSRLVDQMYTAGILGDHKGSVAREVLLTIDEWEQMKAMEEAAHASGTLFTDEDEDEATDEEDEELSEDDDEEEYEDEEEDADDEEYEEEEEEEADKP